SSNNIRKEDNIYLTQMPAGDLNIVVYYKTQTKKKTETETANMDEAISVAKNEGTVIKNSDDQVISIDRSNLNDLFIFVEDVEDDEALEFIGEIAEYKKKLHQTVKDIVGYSLKPTAVCDGQKVNFGKFSEKIDYYLRLDDRTVELINNSDDIMLIEYVDDEINFLSKNDYEISDDKRSIHLSSDNFGDLFIVGMDNYNIKYESHNSSITLRTANIQTADKLVADGELKIKDKSYKISSLRPIYDYYDDSKYAFLYIDISDLEVEAGKNPVEYILDGKTIYSSTINYPFLHTFQTYADNKLYEEEIIKLEAGFPYTIFVPKQLEGGYLLERIVHNLEDNLFRVIENDEGYIYQFYIPEYNISFKTFYSSSAYKEEMSKEELLIELNDTGKQIILYDENGNVLDNNTKITKVHIDKDKIDSVDADIDADMKELISNKIIDSSPLYFDIDFYLMEDSGNKYYSDDLKKDFNIYLDLSDEEYDKLAKNEFVVVRMHTDKDGKISYDKVDATLIPSLKQLKITSDKYSTFAVYTIEKYKFLEGENSSWTINSDKALSFRADGDFNSFESVKIDGKVVESANYDVESGSTIVSLKKEYLNTLSVGTHTITIVFNDGECSANFEIQKNTSNSSSVSARKPVPNTSVR
ncbi:MAG: X2-like carbohydrate binding domain-containing protein, partial [Erysipelotrichaceae bacterium]